MRWQPDYLDTLMAQALRQGNAVITCENAEYAHRLRRALYRRGARKHGLEVQVRNATLVLRVGFQLVQQQGGT